MARFRSRPVEIEAVQWLRPGDHPAVVDAVTRGHHSTGQHYTVESAQGHVEVFPGDWIIPERYAPGKFYPCNPEVFAKRWEAI